ncbi:MAG: glutamine amidotransferase family protein [Dehalococcoidia bacterium]|nr:glutamine amidotransferase family protein [Dehalococcoidia bacterium]
MIDRDMNKLNNPYNDDKVISACSLFGMMDVSGKVFSGKDIIRAIANMHVRSNGLGGGFAVYGLYPRYADYYAFHLMYMNKQARTETEDLLKENFHMVLAEEIPVNPCIAVSNAPGLWRYFLEPEAASLNGRPADDFVIEKVMQINTCIEGAFVFSSGKNMGVFKGAAYPEDIASYFRLEEYAGYLWTAHGRFPTNTPGWWGGAHPFNILDWTVVHNGEISSYGINRRYLEMFGYACTLQTDTEVIAYAVDLLMRRHKLPLEAAVSVLAPAFWEEIERMPAAKQELHRALRTVYGSLLLNGPFTVIIARQGEMMGLTDRIRLRPLTAATRGDMFFLSSEESAIRLVCPELDRAWIPMGGEPVIARLGGTKVVAEGAVAAAKGAC